MLGARIYVIQPHIRHFIAYLLPLPDKKTMTAGVKRDKTTGQKPSPNMIMFAAHFLSEKVQKSIVFCCYGRIWRFLLTNLTNMLCMK